MLERRGAARFLCAAVLLTASWSRPAVLVAEADDAEPEVKATGIVTDIKPNLLTIKADGEESPFTFKFGEGFDKKVNDAIKGLLIPHRVQYTYKRDGDSMRLVSMKRQATKPAGTVTGVVVQNYGWWIAVKPTTGAPEGYALNYGEKNKNILAQFKELRAGDSVTLTFASDFERHRIKTLRKNEGSRSKSGCPR
ncbi:MAG TPA: hypothetical protein VG713_22605 [Pirellulales bacterium]|nr:hypothetical protein [Pirellulales bacterium]